LLIKSLGIKKKKKLYHTLKYFIARKFRFFAVEPKKTAKLKYRRKSILSLTAKLKMHQKT